MKCETCGRGFEPRHRRGRFCKPACRVAGWRKRREATARAPLERVLREAERRVEDLLVLLDEALGKRQ